MSETITCPHCKTTYAFHCHEPPSDDFVTTCQRCQQTFRMIYGRRPNVAADVAAGRPVNLFRCPYCSSNLPPIVKKKITTGGWIVFLILLFFFFPLCWIGLLITDQSTVCRSCGIKLGG